MNSILHKRPALARQIRLSESYVLLIYSISREILLHLHGVKLRRQKLVYIAEYKNL